MKGYTNKGELENYLLTTIKTPFNTQVERWISAIERYIDNQTGGRNFIADTEDDERLYDGDGSSELIIDDVISITSVKYRTLKTGSFTEIDEDYLYNYPANSTPKTKIKYENGRFSKGNQNIKVTGKFGYSEEVPDDIKFVCTVLVAGIINYSSKDSQGQVQTKTVGRYSVTYKDEKQWQDFEQIKKILDPYKRHTF